MAGKPGSGERGPHGDVSGCGFDMLVSVGARLFAPGEDAEFVAAARALR